ncbi:MAG TPA: glycosyl hydrolase, partial [Verrucomicrobiae bacterium]
MRLCPCFRLWFLFPIFVPALAFPAADFRLPDPLDLQTGEKVTSASAWTTQRRAEILELFRSNVYGRAPVARPAGLEFKVTELSTNAMDEKATRKQVKISFTGPGGEGAINLILFVPNGPAKPVACFLLICNRGTENIDPTRTKKSPFWPAEQIVARGYAAAAFYNGDVAPDKYDGFTSGAHRIFPAPGGRSPDSWGTIAAWAWGASRAMDYLETDTDIDSRQVAVVGHSRGGKTALWAGAEDERFAMVISNESGSTGAALARGKQGERIADINKGFPHWFCDNYKRYNSREEALPVDQHMLAALIAPRLLYIASATQDLWSDPANEFLAAVHAGPVYRLFGLEGLSTTIMPAPESPLHDGQIGYHLRSGKHDLTEYDWGRFMDFADQHLAASSAAANSQESGWPASPREARLWTYWWWMGSAVDETNLTRELQRYHDAGMGGVHIIPIYGAKGYEERFIDYLSPRWMAMLDYTVREAGRLGLGVDMTTGSGWCFGGPRVTDQDANASVVAKTFEVAAGGKVEEKVNPKGTQAVVAFSGDGKILELTDRLTPEGLLDWSPSQESWRVYVITQKPSGQKVKRAGPGGQGHMLNLIYPEAMRHFLSWFDEALAGYTGALPRAVYHDSYEYRSDWSPDFFAAFEHRRGYRLQRELPALFGSLTNDLDRVARVKSDYRETVSDVMAEESLPAWAQWARQRGLRTRNEAHGSPGNWLDLYAAADIPETEMFHKDRNKLISKFASSAAHVAGKNLVAAETGTWLKEHFTETLADMKYLVDDLFLSGVNHVFYHGTCYSPDEAGWPGWLFYASFEMNPRNSIWRDVPALNAYVTRCQSVLQAGRPDSDILLYWPIYDLWHNPAGLVRNLTVHARDWFEEQPIGKAAEQLWNRGYAFDYASDRQLAAARAVTGKVRVPGGDYSAILVPR